MFRVLVLSSAADRLAGRPAALDFAESCRWRRAVGGRIEHNILFDYCSFRVTFNASLDLKRYMLNMHNRWQWGGGGSTGAEQWLKGGSEASVCHMERRTTKHKHNIIFMPLRCCV